DARGPCRRGSRSQDLLLLAGRGLECLLRLGTSLPHVDPAARRDRPLSGGAGARQARRAGRLDRRQVAAIGHGRRDRAGQEARRDAVATMSTTTTIRFGMLGAARIGNWGLVQPTQRVAGTVLHAVAARDQARARAYAKKYRIARVHTSYEELLADPEIDAIY